MSAKVRTGISKLQIQEQKKEKTKAKKRYLKRKKERKKVRHQGNPAGVGTAASPSLEKDDRDQDEGEWEDEEVDEAKVAKTPTKRPKKKRKLDLDEPDSDDAASMDVLVDRVDFRSTPSLVGALPSFPLPKHPDAPSKTDLALQGLDKSLVDAEIVWDEETQNLDDIGSKMSGRMKRRLKELGIVELFAVQKVLLPILLPSETSLYTPYDPPPDVCVSAPTGSGKTLAYGIPIIETLSQRIVTRLRALVVLPTRDLVTQVRETMESLSKGTSLKIGTVTGQHSFANEQIGLVGNAESSDAGVLEGGSSRIDILICTPGRLIDHLEGTPNFTLQHLRFLERFVIDEADKLLAQSFQDWLSRVLAATRPPALSHPTFPPFPCPDALSPFHVPHSSWRLPSSCRLENPQSSTQKLLFSATITSDPGKLRGLGLRGPVKWVVVRGAKNQKEDVGVGGVLDVVMERFEVPSTLTEHYIITPTSLKPLVLLYLVLKHGVTNALVFTKSAESTERLMRLCDLFCGEGEYKFDTGEATEGDEGKGLVVRAYSSDLSVGERKTVLDMFKNRKVHILIASDLISRGIDITHVGHVVSYDAPVDMRKYVHRIGRTARAGREGHAWCLVEEHEARYFKQMLVASDHLWRVKKMRVGEKELEGLRNSYDVALGKLRDIYVGGK